MSVFFPGFMGNDMECETNKLLEPLGFGSHDLYFQHSESFPMNPEKRHSFLIFTMLRTKTVKH